MACHREPKKTYTDRLPYRENENLWVGLHTKHIIIIITWIFSSDFLMKIITIAQYNSTSSVSLTVTTHTHIHTGAGAHSITAHAFYLW